MALLVRLALLLYGGGLSAPPNAIDEFFDKHVAHRAASRVLSDRHLRSHQSAETLAKASLSYA
eukprot:1191228-Prorocentrum_minimum.AAC.2